jgi:hypothetical protein
MSVAVLSTLAVTHAAQSQGSALNDSNFFSPQEAVNGPVFTDNTQLLRNTGSSSALNGSYFSAAAIAETMSDDAGALDGVASLVEVWGGALAESARSFGIAALVFGAGADYLSGASRTKMGLNLAIGSAPLYMPLSVFGSVQYGLANFFYSVYFPGGSTEGWHSLETELQNMNDSGSGP